MIVRATRFVYLCAFYLLLCLQWSYGDLTYAAEIESTEIGDCKILLTGSILVNDYIRLKRIAQDIPNTPERRLCLNSTGGSFWGGVLLFEAISELGIPTRIDAGMECYSACAIAFMGGLEDHGEFKRISRELNVKGKLGFHAPFFELASGTNLDIGRLEQMTETQSRAFAYLLRLNFLENDTLEGQRFPTTLLIKMFERNSDELELLDTYGEAIIWSVRLDGYKDPPDLDFYSAQNACANMWNFYDSRFDLDETSHLPIRQREMVLSDQYVVPSIEVGIGFGQEENPAASCEIAAVPAEYPFKYSDFENPRYDSSFIVAKIYPESFQRMYPTYWLNKPTEKFQ
ncbi:MAG: hypothetical protein KDJ19_14600 [Hyphomicrobiaceae bacterium]|nr:hypothetical protein [Hyphomicrobiaceae bacterium]MCC0022655.1 hypothetical protein [Hyphomicrobiaceae bacterium]